MTCIQWCVAWNYKKQGEYWLIIIDAGVHNLNMSNTLKESRGSGPLVLEFGLDRLQVMACHVVAYHQRMSPDGQALPGAEICLIVDGGIYLMACGTDGLHGSNDRDMHYIVHAEGTSRTNIETQEIAHRIGTAWGTEIIEITGLAKTITKATKVGHQTLRLELWDQARRMLIRTSQAALDVNAATAAERDGDQSRSQDC
jgi:hypothetical protein